MSADSDSECSYPDDDGSFFIGEEGVFRASESVCDSDLSVTDDEGDEVGSVWTDGGFNETTTDVDADNDALNDWTMDDEDARSGLHEHFATPRRATLSTTATMAMRPTVPLLRCRDLVTSIF